MTSEAKKEETRRAEPLKTQNTVTENTPSLEKKINLYLKMPKHKAKAQRGPPQDRSETAKTEKEENGRGGGCVAHRGKAMF